MEQIEVGRIARQQLGIGQSGATLVFSTSLKPGVSAARTGVWPQRRASAVSASITHGAVNTPPITSTTFISGTGLKK